MAAHRIAMLRKEQEKIRWLNSPNNYQKVEFYEKNSDRPKVITKWVQDGRSSSQGTPVKITSPHQFSPFGTNPKEFKQCQKKLKENRLMGTTSAGPQSQVLNGATYEALTSNLNKKAEFLDGPADHCVIIGTASKGIIDREHQHNAQVYRHLYAPNPFSTETDEEIQSYLKEMESKSRSTSDLDKVGNVSEQNSSNFDQQRVSLIEAAKNGRRREMNNGNYPEDMGKKSQQPTEIPRSKSSTLPKCVTGRLRYTSDMQSETPSATQQLPASQGKAKKKKKGLFSSFGRKKINKE